MEIRFDNVKYKNVTISFDIFDSGIYSFIGNNKSVRSLIVKMFNNEVKYSGNIYIKNNYKIGICKLEIIKSLRSKKVKQYFEYILKLNNYKEKYINYRINNVLRFVNLDNSYLDKKISDLKYIELKKILLASSIIHNPKILIIEDYTEGLIKSDKKEFERLLRILKIKYKKIIMLFSKDTNFCYAISDLVYLLDENGIVTKSDRSILTNISLLNKIGLEVPSIVKFINECNKEGHAIDNYTNILDLIKSIYREVR